MVEKGEASFNDFSGERKGGRFAAAVKGIGRGALGAFYKNKNREKDEPKKSGFEPLTYREAASNEDLLIGKISEESLRKRNPRLSDDDINVIKSFATIWDLLSLEKRKSILKDGGGDSLKGMVSALSGAGIIKVGTVEQKEPDDKKEEAERARLNKIIEIAGRDDMKYWLDRHNGISIDDLRSNADKYTIDALNGLEQRYKDERSKLVDSLMGYNDFADWYENQVGDPYRDLIAPGNLLFRDADTIRQQYDDARRGLLNSLTDGKDRDEFIAWYERKGGDPYNLLAPDANMSFRALCDLKKMYEERPRVNLEVGDDSLVAVGLSSKGEIDKRAQWLAKEQIEGVMGDQKGVSGFLKSIWIDQTRGIREHRIVTEIKKKIYEKNRLLIEKEAGRISFDEEDRLAELENELSSDSWSASGGDTERFVLAYVNNMREMISSNGESMRAYGVDYVETDEDELDGDGNAVLDGNGNPKKMREARAYRIDRKNGEEVKTPVVGEAANLVIAVEGSIRSYASDISKIEQNTSLDPETKKLHCERRLDRFHIDMAKLKRKDINSGGDGLMINNYEKVAINAAERAKNESSIDAVMAGFRYIDGKINRDVNTEAHHNAIEKIARVVGNVPFIPSEAVTVSAIAAMKFASKSAGLVGLGAGLVAGGAIAAGNVNEKHAVATRAIATGAEVGYDARHKGKVSKTAEEFITDEYGDVVKVNALSDDLNSKVDKLKAKVKEYQTNRDKSVFEDLRQLEEELGKSIFDARNRLQMGANNRVDLIAFSSENLSTIESERLNLWKSIEKAQIAYKEARKDAILINPDDVAKVWPKIHVLYEESKAQLSGIIQDRNKAISRNIMLSIPTSAFGVGNGLKIWRDGEPFIDYGDDLDSGGGSESGGSEGGKNVDTRGIGGSHEGGPQGADVSEAVCENPITYKELFESGMTSYEAERMIAERGGEVLSKITDKNERDEFIEALTWWNGQKASWGTYLKGKMEFPIPHTVRMLKVLEKHELFKFEGRI